MLNQLKIITALILLNKLMQTPNRRDEIYRLTLIRGKLTNFNQIETSDQQLLIYLCDLIFKELILIGNYWVASLEDEFKEGITEDQLF
ncbi:unnamed protein product [Paramecium octaurelia]|uniref:Uncharacterized protein n=1 Tax=Paramecium octaurelia TaxID=43137 RepID=A0A8S1YBD9_PAROT|nr:unnamed protein product [Paramecium octaurelia]